MNKMIHFGLYLIVLAVPISIHMGMFDTTGAQLQTGIPAVDILIVFFFILWAVKKLRERPSAKIIFPPAPFWLLLAAVVASAFFSKNIIVSIKDIIQIIDYFFLGYILFVNNIASTKHLFQLIYFLAGTTAVVVFYGFYQYAVLGADSYLISSLFSDRNVLAGFFVILLPIYFGLIHYHQKKMFAVALCLLIVASLMIITSIPAFFILACLLCGMMLFSKFYFRAIAVLVLFAIILALPLGVRIGHLNHGTDIFFEADNLDEYHSRIEKSVKMAYKPPIYSTQLGGRYVQISSSMLTAKVIPLGYVHASVSARSKDEVFSSGQLSQRLLEWQAALNLFMDGPYFGTGIGTYQDEIGHFYRSFPKLNSSEPNTQNNFLIVAATTGIIGLSALLWLILYFLKMQISLIRSAHDQSVRRMSAGFAGSLAGFSLYNIFCPLTNQTITILFVLVVSFTQILHRCIPPRNDSATIPKPSGEGNQK